MAVIYYPKNTLIENRELSGSNLIESIINIPIENSLIIYSVTGSVVESPQNQTPITNSISSETCSYAHFSQFSPVLFDKVKIINGKLILPSQNNNWYELSVFEDSSGSSTTLLNPFLGALEYNNYYSYNVSNYTSSTSTSYSISSSHSTYCLTSSYCENNTFSSSINNSKILDVIYGYVTQDQETTSNTPQDMISMSFNVGPNETWKLEAIIGTTLSSSGGIKFSVEAPSGSLLGLVAKGSSASPSHIRSSNVLTSNIVTTSVGDCKIYGVIITGGEGGTFKIKYLSTDGVSTATIKEYVSNFVSYRLK